MQQANWRTGTDGLSWDSDGRVVELVYADGHTARGEVYVDTLCTGEDEIPIFTVGGYSPSGLAFTRAERWRFVDESAEEGSL